MLMAGVYGGRRDATLAALQRAVRSRYKANAIALRASYGVTGTNLAYCAARVVPGGRRVGPGGERGGERRGEGPTGKLTKVPKSLLEVEHIPENVPRCVGKCSKVS